MIKNFVPKYYPQGSVTQFFGENKELYSKSVCYGTSCLQGHNGWDIVAPWGTPILAVEAGKVVVAKESDTGFGKEIRIVSKTGREWTYGHMSSLNVVQGQDVNQGDEIGKMGNTGFVVSGATPYWKYNPYAGTHLHLGLRKVALKTEGTTNILYPSGDKGIIENYENGFFGAVDPTETLTELGWIKEETEDIRPLQLTVISLANEVISLLRKLIAMR